MNGVEWRSREASSDGSVMTRMVSSIPLSMIASHSAKAETSTPLRRQRRIFSRAASRRRGLLRTFSAMARCMARLRASILAWPASEPAPGPPSRNPNIPPPGFPAFSPRKRASASFTSADLLLPVSRHSCSRRDSSSGVKRMDSTRHLPCHTCMTFSHAPEGSARRLCSRRLRSSSCEIALLFPVSNLPHAAGFNI